MPAPNQARAFILVSILMVTQTIGWGTTFSQIGIMSEPISADLGLARSTIFGGGTVMYVCAALMAPFAGRLADRIGGLRMLAPGSVAIAFGLWLFSASTGLFSYIAAWVVFGLAMHVGLVTASYTGVTQVMGAKAAKAIGTLTLATGLCSSIFWPITDFALGYLDWREVLRLFALVSLVFCAPLHLWLALRYGHLRAGEGAGAPLPAPAHIRPGAERSGQRLMILIASCGSFIGVGFGIAVIDIFVSLGASRSEAVYAGSLIGIAYVVSRGLATLWSDRISPVTVSTAAYLCLPLSLAPLLYYALSQTPLPGLMACAVAVGFGLPAGLTGILRSTFPLFLFGSSGYGARLGAQARVTEMASAVSPTGLAWALSLSASGAVGILVGLGTLAFVGTVRIRGMVNPTQEHTKTA